jgi:hypothetical protein
VPMLWNGLKQGLLRGLSLDGYCGRGQVVDSGLSALSKEGPPLETRRKLVAMKSHPGNEKTIPNSLVFICVKIVSQEIWTLTRLGSS